MGIFWICYGIAGLFGYQNIREKYKGHSWTKDYIRCQGITWLLLGLSWLGIYGAFYKNPPEALALLVILILGALPGLGYSFYVDRKFKKRLKESEH